MNFKTAGFAFIQLGLITSLTFLPSFAVSKQEAMEAIANLRGTPYLGLEVDTFRHCFSQSGANLFNEMFDETYPYFEQDQAALQTLVLVRVIETIPRGQLVNYMTEREKEWNEYKRAYGYISFLYGPSLGGLLDMLRDEYFSATKRYMNNYSLGGLYQEYADARYYGQNHEGAWRAVENATFNSRSMGASWHNAVGQMQDLTRKFDIRLPGDVFLEKTFEFSYKKKYPFVDLDTVVESFLRGTADQAKDGAIRTLLEDPNLRHCVEDVRTGNLTRQENPLSPGAHFSGSQTDRNIAEVDHSRPEGSIMRVFVLDRIIFSKYHENSDLCGENDNCKQYKRSASGQLIEDSYSISEGEASYSFKCSWEGSGEVLSDYSVTFAFQSPPEKIFTGDTLHFKTQGQAGGFTKGWFLKRSFTYYLKRNGNNNYEKDTTVEFSNREMPGVDGLFRGQHSKSNITDITIPPTIQKELVIGGKLGWDPGLYIDWIYKEVTD